MSLKYINHKKFFLLILPLFLQLCFNLSFAFALHPRDVVSEKEKGNYLRAIEIFKQLPKRQQSASSLVAVAEAYWALGLNKEADKYFSQALTFKNLSKKKRAYLWISRGVIEFQKHNFTLAVLYAKKALPLTNEFPLLKARAELLIGDSLFEQENFSSAEKHYKEALKYSAKDEKPAVYYRLGETALKIGALNKALNYYKMVPINYSKGVKSLKKLAFIYTKLKDYKNALEAIQTGKKLYPDEFEDSYIDYLYLLSALKAGKQKLAEQILQKAEKDYPASDNWLLLMKSEKELAYWRE
ncbi:MAG: hypothetical protein D6780_00040 [Candidatus Dadabacteria bacterium]|nr:MAG: hypothetical protein D6780_00040 [Candidatus Dadabacteria bacterium]